MPLSENVLEEIIFSHPTPFFPTHGFERYARQLSLGPRATSSRIDIAFRATASNELHLYEVKAAGKATLAVERQVERYLREVRALQSSECECPFPTPPIAGVIAPTIPDAVKQKLVAAGVAWFEFPEDQFARVAQEHGISLVQSSALGLRLQYWTSLDRHLRESNSFLGGIAAAESNHVNVVSFDGLQSAGRLEFEFQSISADVRSQPQR